jgi:nicotinamidase-related amidase
MPNVAVLTNDLQYQFIDYVPGGRELAARIIPPYRQFLDAIRSLGHVVVHLQLINDPDDPQVQRRFRNATIPVLRGTPGTELLPELVDPSDIIIEKNRDSGFYETPLDAKLQELGVKTVLVTGLQTQICVQTTAADAFFRGYKVWIPEEFVFSIKEEDKQRSLDWMRGYCAVVCPAMEILQRLQQADDLPGREELEVVESSEAVPPSEAAEPSAVASGV